MTPKILPTGDPSFASCEDYLTVNNYPSPMDHKVMLANVKHVSTFGLGARWLPVVSQKPMNHKEAMELALEYAQENDVPVIYAKPSEEALPQN